MGFASRWRALTTVSVAVFLFGSSRADQFVQVNLVSDGFLPAVQFDPNLKNPWGLAMSPSGPFWVANNGTDTTTVYNSSGTPFPFAQPLIVKMPPGTAPTGMVFNGGPGFPVSDGASTAPSRFIWVSESGQILGWNPTISPDEALPVTITVITATPETPLYKGAALAEGTTGPMLYATNFKAGRVDAFDQAFDFVGSFADPNIPSDYGPFGIENVHGLLVVTYAKADDDREDDVAGPGFGYVDIFRPNGELVRRLVSNGRLNAPWGIALAPSTFGPFHNDLLIGNFGDGRINAYRPGSGQWDGTLKMNGAGRPIEIEGLWALKFGNGGLGGDKRKLYFTAGSNDEADGLFGYVAFHGNH